MKKRVAGLMAIGFLFGRVALGSTELFTNGGFEAGSAPWQPALAITNVPVVSNPAGAHTGSNYISMGHMLGVQSEWVYENISIPTNALVVRLSYFWACSRGADPVGAVVFSPGIQLGQNAVFPDAHGSDNTSYQEGHVDLTDYAGKTVIVGFVVQAQATNSGLQTAFSIDDASLRLFTADDIPANDDFANATLLTTTTNVSVTVTNIVATKETGEPKHAGANGGHSVWWKWVAPGNGTLTVNTTNSTFNTVLAVYTGATVSNLTQVAANDDIDPNRGTLTSKVKATVTTGTEYKIAVDGKGSASGVAQLHLSFTVDTEDPKAVISSPKSGAKLTNSSVAIQGTASDNVGVALVQYRLENAAGTNDFQDANGTNAWTAVVDGLIPGPNTIRVRAFDTSGNESPSVASTVTFVVPSPLTVTIAGSGTISPNLNGTLQNVGTTLTMTAKPGAGYVFGNWSGDISANTAALTFVMRSNMVLQANFFVNPFLPVVGTYQGLFYDTNGPTHESSGFLNAKLSSAGAFTAKVMLAGKSYSLSGQFTADGSFSNNIVRKGLTPVSAQLHMNLGGGAAGAGGITGVLSDGNWTAELVANKTQTSPGATAGKYTLVLPGGLDGVAQPGGDGYGTLSVSTTGAIGLKGALADGSKVTQKANLLTTGQWPFYVSLYAGNGSILGWLTFTNGGYIVGPVDWFKKAQPGAKLYPAGFTNVSDAAGSIYLFTNGVPVLDFSTGQFSLINGNLAAPLIDAIALDSASKITSTNATLKISISIATGSFKGSVANPAGGSTIPFSGVVLQKQNVAGGFFIGTTQTGRAHIGP